MAHGDTAPTPSTRSCGSLLTMYPSRSRCYKTSEGIPNVVPAWKWPSRRCLRRLRAASDLPWRTAPYVRSVGYAGSPERTSYRIQYIGRANDDQIASLSMQSVKKKRVVRRMPRCLIANARHSCGV